MASVSSLDQDMRRLRLERYTPAAAKETRQWIEETLGEKLAPGDLMDALKDGVALCKLVNRVTSPGVRFKASKMPFVQMENISHFLRACEMPPLSLPSHDRFLTVDLYDRKDPAQVLQCIAAFSRRANATNPRDFPKTIGAASKGGAMSPQGTGSSQAKTSSYTVNNPPAKSTPDTLTSNKSTSLARGGLASGGPVSSWSKKSDEDKTAPAWNIHQYGYMGGANQGNQGVSFGARRQLVTPQPQVPSLAEKEKRLKAVEEQRRLEAEEEVRRNQAAVEEEESRAREEEERRWAEETRKAREQEEQLRRQDQQNKVEEEQPEETSEQKYEARLLAQRNQQRQVSDSRLNGQFLSQYRAGQPQDKPASQESAESKRIAELERQLAEAKEAAGKAEHTRHGPQSSTIEQNKPPLPARPQEPPTAHEDDWDASERDYLKKQWHETQKIEAESQRHTLQPSSTSTTTRPLPNPSTYIPNTNRTDRFLSSNPAPQATQPTSHRPQDYSTTAEVDLENQRRITSQQKTKAGGWASKSLLEREMERERERQREWEENQREVASRPRLEGEGSAPGQSWDVNQHGYTGGANQFKGGAAFSLGGARRQIIGPRPPP